MKDSGELFGYSEQFWKYIRKFWRRCTKSGRDYTKFTKECSEEVMEAIEPRIDPKVINRCVKKDWRKLLSKEIRNHAWSPLAMRINGWRYNYGDYIFFTAASIFDFSFYPCKEDKWIGRTPIRRYRLRCAAVEQAPQK